MLLNPSYDELNPTCRLLADCRVSFGYGSEWMWSGGGMVLTGETEVLGEKHYTAWVVDGWMSMEQWWNDTDRGN